VEKCGVWENLLIKCRIATGFIPEVVVRMMVGGKGNRNLRNLLSRQERIVERERLSALHKRFYTIPLKNMPNFSQFISFRIKGVLPWVAG